MPKENWRTVFEIGDNFYDCMSSGASVVSLSVVRKLILQFGVDVSLEVYPKENGCHTVEDFLRETSDIEDVFDASLLAESWLLLSDSVSAVALQE